MTRHILTEEEKIDILKKCDLYPRRWSIISRLTGIAPSTIKSFYLSYQKHGKMFPKRGRKQSIDPLDKQDVINYITIDPELSLNDLASMTDISKTSVYNILLENKITYHPKIAISPVTDRHKRNRVQFSMQFANIPYQNIPQIIFTDESTVEVNLKNGGVWRKRGFYNESAFYIREAHPLRVMVWGAIGPLGFRTPLILVRGNMDSESYIQMLRDNQIFPMISQAFGNHWWYQQDNAPPHCSKWSREQLQTMVPNLLEWPARSPDLSPIEHLWGYLKSKIAGKHFSSEQCLFDTLSKEWAEMPFEVVHNAYSSFQARCKVCFKYQGSHLNGHWKEVKNEHDSYRTQLMRVWNPWIQSFQIQEFPV